MVRANQAAATHSFEKKSLVRLAKMLREGQRVFVFGPHMGRQGSLYMRYEGTEDLFQGNWWVDFDETDTDGFHRTLAAECDIRPAGHWLRRMENDGRSPIQSDEAAQWEEMDRAHAMDPLILAYQAELRKPPWEKYVRSRAGVTPWHMQTLHRLSQGGAGAQLPDTRQSLSLLSGAKRGARWARAQHGHLQRPKAAPLKLRFRPVSDPAA